MIGIQIIIVILSYLLGSIPFGYILTKKLTGLNILELGSGNIGSTNVRRIAGNRIAIKVQILDMLKGLLPVASVILLNKAKLISTHDYYVFLVALSTILGHNFSIFLLFKGGKGVNTTLGASVLLAPIEVFSSVVVYFFVKSHYKYVSYGSISLAITLVLVALVLNAETWLLYYLFFCCGLILFRHISNIKRLIRGNEMKSEKSAEI
jgi:glycerol-3-phosphate acyltransferase PlsY